MVATDHHHHVHVEFVQTDPPEGGDSHNCSSDSSLPRDFSTEGAFLVFFNNFFEESNHIYTHKRMEKDRRSMQCFC